jgi:cell wall-associated NlpC family hydrolase
MNFQRFTKTSLQVALMATAVVACVSYGQNIDENNQVNNQNATGNLSSSNPNSTFVNSAANSLLNPSAKSNFYGKVTTQLSESSSTLINNAMKLIGVRYRWGDQVQTGFDASAFVKYVLKDNLGFLFPVKTTDDMSKVGLQVSRESLRPGDLVFFNTLKREYSHVGIYVGENKFIHSPARGSGVRVDDMSSVYWDMRFDGARRVDDSKIPKETLLSQ